MPTQRPADYTAKVLKGGMDETKTRWFRWIADNARHFFWLTWGIGVGAFGAVIFRVVDAGGDGVRVYIGVLTLLMSAALGLASSRAMDHYVDRRNVRRRINRIRLRVGRLLIPINMLVQHLEHYPEALANNRRLFIQYSVQLAAIQARAATGAIDAPNFDDIVTTEEDLHHASRVLHWFQYASGIFKDDKSLVESPEKAEAFAKSFLMGFDVTMARTILGELQVADQHFRSIVAEA